MKEKNSWQRIIALLGGVFLTSCSREEKSKVTFEASKYALIDLHLHLDGSLTGQDVLEMARMGNVELATYDAGELQAMMTCPQDNKDLTEYLTCFSLPLHVMQNSAAIAYSVKSLVKRLDKQGLIYAEIRFAPQLHILQGLTQDEVVQAAIEGLDQGVRDSSGIAAKLILCCMRGEVNDGANLETLQLMRRYLNKGVVAMDLAGAEALFPTSKYAALFKRAIEEGIPFTIHAGEAAGVESIHAALDYGANRIGHGVRSYNNEDTKKRLRFQNVCITLCPTSNMQTRALPEITSYCDYPLSSFLSSGVPFTLNTDNMTVSNTTLKEEFQKLFNGGVLTTQMAEKIVEDSIKYSFLTDSEKIKLLEKARSRMCAK